MQYVRLVHPREWDFGRGRFKSPAFTPSPSQKGGGISVFEPACALSRSGSICAHIVRYYQSVAATPAVFLAFDDTELPATRSVVRRPSTTGDDCHHDILGLTRTEARAFIIGQPLARFLICDGPTARPVQAQDLEPYRPPV